jgi:hypothetical protein
MASERGAEMSERVLIDPEIQHGKPVIRGILAGPGSGHRPAAQVVAGGK